jgi:cell division protein FtsQ
MKARIFKLFQLLVLAAFLGALGWSAYTAAQYLRTNPRFEVRELSVSGLRRVKENQVIERANFDIGANVFTADLDQIRSRVEEIQWVRQALVQRILPNEILIKITEREPVGLARVHGEVYQFDADGMILQPDPASLPSLPILDGLRPGDSAWNKKSAKMYRQVLDELGQNELSEIHVNNAGEVSVVSSNESILVNIGGDDFRARWVKYRQLKSQIQQQYPAAVGVDLRFRNQVIVNMRSDEAEKKVIWDAEKKLL